MGNLQIAVEKAKQMLLEEGVFDAIGNLSFGSWANAIKSFKDIYFIAKKVVFATEIIYSEYHLCSEEERIKVAALVLDDLVAFKGWAFFLESIDGYAFEMLLSAAVQGLNDKYGKGSWPVLAKGLTLKSV